MTLKGKRQNTQRH